MNNCKKVVVKVGTSTLTHETGKLNLHRIEKLARCLSDLKNQGMDIVLVSSGAIGVGMGQLGLHERPHSIREKQAAAAVGQCELMFIYSKLFNEYGHNVAQILLTKDATDNTERRENILNTFNQLFEYAGVIPIVNENDTVSVEEIEFGDNDTMSAIVAKLIGADLLIILSDIDGLYDHDPHKDSEATLIPVVLKVDESIKALAGGTSTNLGTGGMVTKIIAAEIANNAGCDMVLANGENPDILYDIFSGNFRGTLFKKSRQEEI